MANYTKKQEVVDAVQWLKTGDHPKIDSIATKISAEKGEETCNSCGLPISVHGIQDLDGRLFNTICPGSWIITREDGRFEYLNDATFRARYSVAKE